MRVPAPRKSISRRGLVAALVMGLGIGVLLAGCYYVVPPPPFEVIGTATADAGRLTLDGEPVDTSGWDPYAGWDGVSG